MRVTAQMRAVRRATASRRRPAPCRSGGCSPAHRRTCDAAPCDARRPAAGGPSSGFRFLPKSSSMQRAISWLCGSLPSREQAIAMARTSGAVSRPAVERGLDPAQRLGRVERHAGRLDAARDRLGVEAADGLRLDARRREVAGQLLVPGVLVEIGGGEIEQLQPLRMLERVPEPALRVDVFVAVLRQGEVELVVGLDRDRGGADLDGVEERARALAGLQERREVGQLGGLGLAKDDLDQRLGLPGVERRLVVGQDRALLLGRAAVGHGVQASGLRDRR